MDDTKSLVILDESYIKGLIHEIRGQKVMLDFDLARIYGHDTRDLNNQVKWNPDKFDDDFRFQITKLDKWTKILMLQKSTSSWGGKRKLPFVFTEQGIYMLMTVLRGDLAVQQRILGMRCYCPFNSVRVKVDVM